MNLVIMRNLLIALNIYYITSPLLPCSSPPRFFLRDHSYQSSASTIAATTYTLLIPLFRIDSSLLLSGIRLLELTLV